MVREAYDPCAEPLPLGPSKDLGKEAKGIGMIRISPWF